jgi:hypothetical protein
MQAGFSCYYNGNVRIGVPTGARNTGNWCSDGGPEHRGLCYTKHPPCVSSPYLTLCNDIRRSKSAEATFRNRYRLSPGKQNLASR